MTELVDIEDMSEYISVPYTQENYVSLTRRYKKSKSWNMKQDYKSLFVNKNGVVHAQQTKPTHILKQVEKLEYYKKQELENILIYDIPEGIEPINKLKNIFGKKMDNWADYINWNDYRERYVYKSICNDNVYRDSLSIKGLLDVEPDLKTISYSDFINPREELKYDIKKGWNIL